MLTLSTRPGWNNQKTKKEKISSWVSLLTQGSGRLSGPRMSEHRAEASPPVFSLKHYKRPVGSFSAVDLFDKRVDGVSLFLFKRLGMHPWGPHGPFYTIFTRENEVSYVIWSPDS